MNTEHQFQELSQQLDRLDTNAIQARIEAHLRLAWAEQHSTQSLDTMNTPIPTSKKHWHWLQYALGGSGLATLALVTTLVIQPTNIPKPTTSTTQFESTTELGAKSLGLLDATSVTGNSIVADDYEEVWVEDAAYGEVQPVAEYTYKDGDTEQQLLDESVSLSIDVKGEMLDTIHTLREQVGTLDGYLINISYYEDSGTVDIKIPVDQLSNFEDALKQLDVDQAVEVTSYNVVNVSDQIVSIDEGIKFAEDKISQAQQDLAATGLSDADRQTIADQITENESYIKDQQTARAEAVAKYTLVDVRITVNQYHSWLEGNYYQYDRSTFSGQIKYELGRAMYSLIHNTGKLTVFLVWLLVYGVVLVPVFLFLRWLVRKIIRAVRSL